MRIRTVILMLFAFTAIVPSITAQYIRIGNAGTNPNSGILAPTILKSALALYTDDARLSGIEGTVTIEAFIAEDGQIKNMRVLKGLGFGLDEVALTSVREWEFSPATRDGVPVSVVAQIDVHFSLRSANALRIGNGVTPPTVASRVEPRYTQEARVARLQGTIVLQAVVKADGTIDVVRVVRGLADGLTDSAVEALKQWKFRPGKKDGQDVDVALNVEINFNLDHFRQSILRASDSAAVAQQEFVPKIEFTAERFTIQQGESTTLRWKVDHANAVSIQPAIGTVDATGSLEVRPSSSITYMIRATGPRGEATDTVRITVTTRK
jgi:TonB family protein